MKKISLIIGLLASLLLTPVVEAKTPITGTVYGQNLGLIHFDYTTAIRPENYSGAQENFYLSPEDEAFTGPGLADFTAHIFDMKDEGKCDAQSCLLTGFLWNDKVGWILLDGKQIQNALSSETFPESSFARIHFSGPITGYVWSQHAGWINLSLNANGTQTPTASQDKDNWGVWFGADESGAQAFRGYAWSQALGWIKFEKMPEDEIEFGAKTSWTPDSTPPEILAEDQAWFAVNNPDGTITWPQIAHDPESGIRTEDTEIIVKKDPDDTFSNCQEPLTVGMEIDQKGLSVIMPSIGLISTVESGYCKYQLTGTLTNNAGMTFTPNLEFYVRAGTLSEAHSKITYKTDKKAIADGSDSIEVQAEPKDLAGNPIVSVQCPNCPKRTIEVVSTLKNQMHYDSIYQSESYPVRANETYLNALGETESLPLIAEVGNYPLNITSFAPTTETNTLELKNFTVTVQDEELPPITKNISKTDAQNASYTLDSENSALNFSPALTAINGAIKTGNVVNQIINGTPSTLSFNFKNNSPKEVLGNLDVDTIFEFYGADQNGSSALLETQSIQHELSSEAILAWLAPAVPLPGAHYEIFSGKLNDNENLNGQNSIFHASYPILKDIGTESSLSLDGSYAIDGSYGIPEYFEPDSEGNYPEGIIDRSDQIATTLAPSAQGSSQKINFTPAFLFLPSDLETDKLFLKIHQQIAYRFEGQPEFTIYEPESDLIGTLPLKKTGVDFTGLGSGKSIFKTLDKWEVIHSPKLQNIKETLRRNTAEMTLNMNPCNDLFELTELNDNGERTLKTEGPCIKKTNNQVIAFLQGSPESISELGNESDETLWIPEATNYTLILTGGMNLFIKNNIAYQNSDTESSLGMILLQKEGKGANVYLHPKLTNMVGILFTEGSLISAQNPSENAFYYGSGENPQDLKNQLYWQGNIASANTIGGAEKNQLPEGVKCQNATLYQCAQRYDLNFIRRFNLIEDMSAESAQFSGGGFCNTTKCQHGPLFPKSSITLTPEGKIDKENSKSTNAFFIEPLPRPAPPGFSTGEDKQFIEVIR